MNTSFNATSLLMPTELIEKIIFEAWNSTLSADERIQFMTSSLLVNSIWSAVFSRVIRNNIHIPCISYLKQYLSHTICIRGENWGIPREQSGTLPDEYCQSITFRIQKDTAGDDPKMGNVLSSFLSTISGTSCFPNLRTLSVEYENVGHDDICRYDCFLIFPTQITNVEISFSGHIPDADCKKPARRGPPPFSFLFIRELAFVNASDELIAEMAACCPSAKTIRVAVSTPS